MLWEDADVGRERVAVKEVDRATSRGLSREGSIDVGCHRLIARRMGVL